MKMFFVFSMALLCNQMAYCQAVPAKGTGKISGMVLDSISREPISFGTVSLISVATSKPTDGGVCDVDGTFELTKVAAGTYNIVVSFIGYSNFEIANIVIAERGTDLQLGTVLLASATKQLGEVTVVGQRALIEERVDRTIYNAEQDVTTRGSDATEVMRRVPMLSVDLDGNVALRGSTNVRVLINNKPSTIMAASVADALKMIPADQIKSVEVITSPSARYDAEGSGGIINIVLKKNNLEGMTLNVNSGAGNRSSNLGLNGSYRKGKFGATLGGHGHTFYNNALNTIDQTTLRVDKTVRSEQTIEAFDRGIFGRYNMGFDYDLTPTQSLSSGIRFGTRNFLREQEQQTDLFTNDVFDITNFRNVNSRDLSNTVDANLDYLRTFKEQQEWSISTQYSRSGLTNNFDADILDANQNIASLQRNINGNNNQELTLQTDYQTPIGKNQMIEFGGKGIMRWVRSDYEYQVASSQNAPFVLDLSRPSGWLDYNQNVGAAYAAYTLTTKGDYTIKAGSRYEYTGISATTNTDAAIVIPSYSNLVPSINISKKIKGTTTLKAAYNRRIQRPGLQQLNPNFNTANTQNITVGNPTLRPELTDNFELSINGSIKKTYLTLAIFTRLTNNAISQVRVPSDTLQGAVVTTYQNIGQQQGYGANLFGNAYITPKWTVNGGVDVLYAYLEGQVLDINGVSKTFSNTGFNVNGRLMSQYILGRGWGIQANTFMRGAQVQLQGRQNGFYMYSIGLKKDFNNKKGSIGFTADNFLTEGTTQRTELSSPTFTQVNVNQPYNRGFKLTFNYTFGKMGFDQSARKTKSVKNDDIKDGEGGGGNGGGDMNGGGGTQPQRGGGQMPAGGAKPSGSDKIPPKPGDKTPPKTDKKPDGGL